MGRQVRRFSPHQNAKVFAVLMTIGSMVFLVPFMLLSMAMAPGDQGMPWLMILAMPLLYLVFGYVSVGVGCWLYNTLYPYIGGVEVEWSDDA